MNGNVREIIDTLDKKSNREPIKITVIGLILAIIYITIAAILYRFI